MSSVRLARVMADTLPGISTIPDPGALPLFLAGIAALAAARRRKQA